MAAFINKKFGIVNIRDKMAINFFSDFLAKAKILRIRESGVSAIQKFINISDRNLLDVTDTRKPTIDIDKNMLAHKNR